MRSIDFVLAFPQADVKKDIYMQPPKVPTDFSIPDLPHFTDRFLKVYKLLKNLYGLKDAGRTWYKYVSKGLIDRGWKMSTIDNCLFIKWDMLILIYVDDAIIVSLRIKSILQEIKSHKHTFDLTDKGVLKDYLGTRFERHNDGSIKLTMPRMIDRVLKLLGLDDNTGRVKTHDSPAYSGKLLDNYPGSLPREQTWHYRGAIGLMSYIQGMNRPDITMATQQCARFCNNSSKEYEEAVKRIGRYLLKTRDKGILMQPDKTKGLECYVDADWAGSW